MTSTLAMVEFRKSLVGVGLFECEIPTPPTRFIFYLFLLTFSYVNLSMKTYVAKHL